MWELIINVLILIIILATSIYDWKMYKKTNLRLKEIEKKHSDLEKRFNKDWKTLMEKEDNLWKGLTILDREFGKWRMRK